MRVLKKSGMVLLCGLLLASCRKPTGANWDVDMVVPVANSQLNVGNFLSDTLFNADETGLLHLVLNREIGAVKLDSLVKLPNTVIAREFTVPVNNVVLNPGEPITLFPPSELTFSLDYGIELVRADIRSGKLTASFSNNISESIDLVYLVPSAVKDGVPLRIAETIPPGNNSLVKTYDLSGYSFLMNTGTKPNTIKQTYTVALNSGAKTVTLNIGDGPKVDLSYENITPQYVQGYFGKQTIDLPETVTDIEIIKNFQASGFKLSDVKMNFKVVNEFGVDFSADLSKIRSINTVNNTDVTLVSDKLSKVEIVSANKTAYSYLPVSRTFSFNSGNSNIADFVSNIPNQLAYEGKITINPNGRDAGLTNFAYYNTGVRIDADIDIPLKFSADYFRLQTVTKTDFANISQLSNVNTGNLVISAHNGFPFSAEVQAYLLDQNNVVYDSLFISGNNVVQRASVNNQNDVVAAVDSRIFIPVDKRKIEQLKKCAAIRFLSTFRMPGSPPDIRILESYALDISIIAELSYHVDISN